MNKNEEASAKTTQQLITTARKHFALHGYANVSLESIVKELEMTRGALYHHFKNKKQLFSAVVNQVQVEVGEYVETEAMKYEGIWEQLVGGCVGFVEIAILESNRKILLIDAPNILDWDQWRKMDNANSVAHLEEQLASIKSENQLVAVDIKYISHMISGGLNELALYLAEAEDVKREDIYEAVTYLLKGFKTE